MILIGEYDKKSGDIIEKIHMDLIDNKPTIHRMNFYNAELAKISLNAYCTLKITFANIIAEICEKIPGGDSHQVLNAIGSDSRVGRKYFKGGLGYSGPCFPRDNRALAHSARLFGTTNYFCEMTDAINNYHKTDRICDLLLGYMKENGTKELAILGLSYKEDTSIIEESVAISVIKNLWKKGMTLNVYDPAAMENTQQELEGYDNLFYAASMYECLNKQSVCFIATPWSEFVNLNPQVMIKVMKKNAIILDAWGMLPFGVAKHRGKKIEVRHLGKNYQ